MACCDMARGGIPRTLRVLAGRAWAALAALALCAALPLKAQAVPPADHVRIECIALRLNVNDYSIRHQIKVLVTVASSDEARLALVENALLTVANPAGQTVNLAVREYHETPKQFKAANARLLFKAVEDSADSAMTNVPAGFFTDTGPYKLTLSLLGKTYGGEFSFGAPLKLSVEQEGRAVSNFTLNVEQPVTFLTEPATFGPVYYKRQDPGNFFFQMASIDQALESGDYHAPVESPRYVFQISIGDGEGGPARLLDPSRYISGFQPHLIRSDSTTTPLTFAGNEFAAGDAVVVDFMREEAAPPDSGFCGPDANFSAQLVVQERVVCALHAEAPPSAEELGTSPATGAPSPGSNNPSGAG